MSKKPAAPRQLNEVARRQLSSDSYTIIRSEDNVLVLDRPRATIGNGKEEKAREILDIILNSGKEFPEKAKAEKLLQEWE